MNTSTVELDKVLKTRLTAVRREIRKLEILQAKEGLSLDDGYLLLGLQKERIEIERELREMCNEYQY